MSEKSQRARETEMLIAGMNIAWGLFTKSFTTHSERAQRFGRDIELRIKEARADQLLIEEIKGEKCTS